MSGQPLIHPTAIVDPASLAPGVQIGPFAVVAKGAILGPGVVVHPHVVIADGVTIGEGTEIFPGTFIGKEPKGVGAVSRQPQFERRVSIGSTCAIGPHAVIYYDVVIGDHTLIADGASVREKGIIGSYSIVGRYVTINYNTRVGSRTKVMDHSWLAGNMTIGDGVFISGGVLTTNDNRPRPDSYSDSLVGQTIEDGVVVGAGATLLPAIRIGRNAVVGAGATVTRDVAAETTVFGTPARVRQPPAARDPEKSR